MAAPTGVARGTPVGIKLKNGYQSKISFDHNPTVSIWEITCKPPGLDGGEAVDQTDMFNTVYRTMRSRSLLTLTPITYKFHYGPECVTQLQSLINVEGVVRQLFPDGSTLDYYGYLQKVEFDELVDGTCPSGTATVVPTNYDPFNGVEASPVLTSVAGT